MLICLLRHGIAEEFNPSRHRHDSDRALTAQGRDELTQQVAGLTRLELPIDVIVKSPYLRATETAQLASAAFGEVEMQTSEHLVPHARLKDTLAVLASIQGAEGVLLVGHEPHLSSLGALLLGDEQLSIEMQRASLLGIELARLEAPWRGVLRFLIPAKVLRFA